MGAMGRDSTTCCPIPRLKALKGLYSGLPRVLMGEITRPTLIYNPIRRLAVILPWVTIFP